MSVRVIKHDLNHQAFPPLDFPESKHRISQFQIKGAVLPWQVPVYVPPDEAPQLNFSRVEFSDLHQPPADDSAPVPSIDLEEIQRQANAILDASRLKADQFLASARTKAAEIETQAREQAFIRGREDGLREGRSRVNDEIAAAVAELRGKLSQSLEELALLPQHIAENSEGDLVQLAIEIAKKIVHREVTVDREIVLSLVRVALTRINRRGVARIHLHPEEYQFVVLNREKLGTGYAIELVEDPVVDRGGCIIETDFGDVDARISQQFSEIERGFFGA